MWLLMPLFRKDGADNDYWAVLPVIDLMPKLATWAGFFLGVQKDDRDLLGMEWRIPPPQVIRYDPAHEPNPMRARVQHLVDRQGRSVWAQAGTENWALFPSFELIRIPPENQVAAGTNWSLGYEWQGRLTVKLSGMLAERTVPTSEGPIRIGPPLFSANVLAGDLLEAIDRR